MNKNAGEVAFFFKKTVPACTTVYLENQINFPEPTFYVTCFIYNFAPINQAYARNASGHEFSKKSHNESGLYSIDIKIDIHITF